MTEVDISKYSSRAIMFGDKSGGGYLQVYAVTRDGEDTGVTVIISAKTRNVTPTKTAVYNGQEYKFPDQAIAAYEADQGSQQDRSQ